MCDFLSVLISKDCETVYVGDLRSHSNTAEHHKLKPGTYREVEWTGDDEKSLAVRTEPSEDDPENWYRACILAKWPTRDKLIEWCLREAAKNPLGGGLYLSDTQVKEIPAGLKVGGDLDLSDTQVKEIPAGLKVGGDLYLRGTRVKEIPAGLKVGGGLYLSGTQVKEIPAGLKVGGGLYLRGTQVRREEVPPALLPKCYW